MPKHEYETAAMTVVELDTTDIVCTSVFGDNDAECPDSWGCDSGEIPD